MSVVAPLKHKEVHREVECCQNCTGVAKSQKSAELEAEIADIQRKLLTTEDEKIRSELQDRLLQNERTLAFEENEVSNPSHPVSQVAHLSSVQHVLRPDELLLEYVLDDPNGFGIAITKDTARILRLPAGRAQIESEVTDYERELSEKRSNPELARRLYATLLGAEIEKI
jgi:hypothetical protein